MSNITPASPLQVSHFSQLSESSHKQLRTASISCTHLGNLDAAKMADYLTNSLQRLEILRTSYQSDEYGALWQHILQATPGNCIELDWRGYSDTQVEQAKLKLRSQDCEVGGNSAWHKLVVAHMNDKTWVYLEVSALNTDAYSLYALLDGVVVAGNTGNSSFTCDDVIQYAELAPWLADFLIEEEMAEARAFWSKDKSTAALASSFALNRYKQTAEKGYTTTGIALGDSFFALKDYASEHGVTVTELVCTSLRLSLRKYAPNGKLSRAFSIRDDESLANVQGPLTRMLPLFPSDSAEFLKALRHEVECTSQGVDYVECFNKNYEHQGEGFSFCFDSIECRDASVEVEQLISLNEQCKIQFFLIEQGYNTTLQVTYDVGAIDAGAIEQLLNTCQADLLDATAIESRQDSNFAVSGPQEQNGDVTVLDIFSSGAATVTGTVVEVDGRSASVQDINEQANKLAHHLITSGVNKGDVVALCLARSIDFVTAMLAILKVGGVYVPVDISLPIQRITGMLHDAQAQVLISSGEFIVEGCQSIDCSSIDLSCYSEVAPNIELHADDLAYILFTSGSTGKAKGVSISHRALVNQMNWINNAFSFTPEDRFLQRTSASFDASIWEFWSPLLIGATMVIAPQEINYDMKYFLEVIERHQISRMQIVPSLLELLIEQVDEGKSSSLMTIFCGGEALKTQIAHRAHITFSCGIVNLYGPSECCVNATAWQYSDDLCTDFVPIGSPINNLVMRIIKADGSIANIGESGELYIAGDSLFSGYYNQPTMTQAALCDSLNDGRIYYKTGDHVRVLADGSLMFLERLDDQIKLNGYRIEPEEVSMLATKEQLANKAECIFNSDSNSLVLFYVGEQVSEQTMLEAFAAALPEYMIPQQLISIDDFPYLSNGKLDKRALLERARNHTSESYIAAATETEAKLVEIWQDLLNVPFAIGTNHDFFEIGGHSIVAMKVLNRVIEEFDINIGVRVLFEHKTVADLAAYIEPLILLNQEDNIDSNLEQEGGML